MESPESLTSGEIARRVQIAERTAAAFREIADLTNRHADGLRALGMSLDTATRFSRITYAAEVGAQIATASVAAAR